MALKTRASVPGRAVTSEEFDDEGPPLILSIDSGRKGMWLLNQVV